ncbi:LPS export ABC transporter periplasmic protein LptC [Mesorhizobium sp. SP-1A]|uniref:LPS export ABC transporter periplasmic protein LptC n=1 Tax=Mesorhizobium sp. SP-1A TaxID=3077840 RepID=UPI0028F742CC|nr:LPS export ABC transporter periplasmic protein LptC [Mesorhizobium sp. SP-1A]
MTATEAPGTELPEGDVAPAKTVQGSPRAVAFGRAERHSRRVRVMKLALPLTAAVIAVAFPLYSYMSVPHSTPVQADGSAFSNGKLVMANPKLDGFTKENLPYSMSAVRAIQDVSKESVIQLEGIAAKLPISADNIAAVTAKHGVYDRDNNTMHLDKDFTITMTDGMVAKLKSAFLDIGKGIMKTEDPVDITSNGTHITSDAMSVGEHGKVLVFENRVRVNIDPAAAKKADNDKGGEPNAVQ